jgi:hypothetical protein
MEFLLDYVLIFISFDNLIIVFFGHIVQDQRDHFLAIVSVCYLEKWCTLFIILICLIVYSSFRGNIKTCFEFLQQNLNNLYVIHEHHLNHKMLLQILFFSFFWILYRFKELFILFNDFIKNFIFKSNFDLIVSYYEQLPNLLHFFILYAIS